MELVTFFLLSILTLVTAYNPSNNDNYLSVPKDVFDHILKCQHVEVDEKPTPQFRKVPVHNIEIGGDDSVRSENIQMLDIRSLEDKLGSVFTPGDYRDHVISQVHARTSAFADPSFRQKDSCPPTTNIIKIDVPPNELVIFHEKIERATQLNNNVLMSLFHQVLSHRFRDLEKNLKAYIDKRDVDLQESIKKTLQELSMKEVTSTMERVPTKAAQTSIALDKILETYGTSVINSSMPTAHESKEEENITRQASKLASFFRANPSFVLA